jgi:AraC-like DNA-binding protein
MKRETFTDFDAFRATNPQLDGQWLLNGGRDYRWSSESLTVGDCGVLRCYSHTGLIIEGSESLGCYHFYVPFKSHVWRNNGFGFNDDEILVFEPGAEQCETSKAGDGWHGFFVPKHLVSIEPETRGDRARCSYTVKTDSTRTEAVRNLFKGVIAAVAETPEIESSPAARMVEADLRYLLLPILETDIDDKEGREVSLGRPRISRQEVVQRSRAILEERDSEAIHVSELATLVGVSERSLRSVFHEYYQIGPRQYLFLRQLHKVRRDLVAADPDDTTVTAVLTRWGVWNFGRFSGKYKSQFGELPGQTLRRTSLVIPGSAVDLLGAKTREWPRTYPYST